MTATSRLRFQAYAIAITAVLIGSALLYTARLNHVPPFLSTDETAFALQAHAIATTAHDQNGRLLPLYFEVLENVWFHPGLVYWMASVLTILKPAPWVVRLPVALVALGNIFLVSLLARRLGLSRAAAVAASILLALAPIHVLHGRFACDYLLPIPCVLVSLILLIDAERFESPGRLFAAGCALGLGLYTYISALVVMPVCLLLLCLTLLARGVRRPTPYVLLIGGFALLVLPLAAYLLVHPRIYASFVARYGGPGINLDVLHHPSGVFGLAKIAERWPIYKSFFERSFLFERAETHVMSSTYTTGVFLKAMEVLIPIGVYHLLRNRRNAYTCLLLATFLSAPLAASLIPEKYAIDRALLLLPTGALLGAFGVEWLLAPRTAVLAWPSRIVCGALFVWMAFQFNDFYRDYQTAYPVRAAFWFDGNHPGAFEPIVQRYSHDDSRLIYMDRLQPRIKDHWKLYLLGQGRRDLLKRTVLFGPDDLHLGGIEPGTLFLTGADDALERALLKTRAVTPIVHVAEPDGSPVFTIFERTAEAAFDRFDGTFSATVAFTCSDGGAGSGCEALATTVSCPSLETVTVASSVVVDSCGYLAEAAVAPDGSYSAPVTKFGFPIRGVFSTSGPVRLSGSGVYAGRRYELAFRLVRR